MLMRHDVIMYIGNLYVRGLMLDQLNPTDQPYRYKVKAIIVGATVDDKEYAIQSCFKGVNCLPTLTFLKLVFFDAKLIKLSK